MRPFIGTCAETQDRLSDHLEGTLPDGRERRVRRHLRYCSRCHSLFESLRRTVESMRTLGLRPDTDDDVSVADDVVDRIRRSDL